MSLRRKQLNITKTSKAHYVLDVRCAAAIYVGRYNLYLVADIDQAVREAELSGAVIVVPPMVIPERGQCAIVKFGKIQSGFWQL